MAARGPRPVITLTTDFGLSDAYVAQVKAALLRHCPEARLIDVTHQVPRHDILCGSIMLERAVDGFPPSTVHLAVVDPGVGTARRILVAALREHRIVCPDNGLITWAWRLHGPGSAFQLTWRPAPAVASSTFHGRDIMAPVAGMLAAGVALDALAIPLDNPVLLEACPARATDSAGQVIHLDHFGNATTNLPQAALAGRPQLEVQINGRPLGRLRRTYGDVEPGNTLALIGSSGLLEIAVRDGSAAETLRLKVGDRVELVEARD